MEARVYPENTGADTITAYGVEVTESDLIMVDGKSLEHAGVTPDSQILPTGEDLALGRDPQLALAFELAGSKVAPEQAGKLFPIVWRMR